MKIMKYVNAEMNFVTNNINYFQFSELARSSMRRSAAPSQLHAAKRAKFTVPYKVPHSTAIQTVE